MIKKIILFILVFTFLSLCVGCGYLIVKEDTKKQKFNKVSDQNDEIVLDFIKIPEQLIINTPETIKRLEELSKQQKNIFDRFKTTGNLTKKDEEELERLTKLQKEILDNRKKITNEKVIKEIFIEIKKLKVKVVKEKDYRPSKTMICSFDLVDDKEKGLSGNVEKQYYRYMILQKDQHIVIPILYEDGKKVFFAKAKISEELFKEIKNIINNTKLMNSPT